MPNPFTVNNFGEQRQTWDGQGELIGGGIPYIGGDSLGICYGLSIAWLIYGPNTVITRLEFQNVDKLIPSAVKLQGELASEMELGIVNAMNSTYLNTINPAAMSAIQYTCDAHEYSRPSHIYDDTGLYLTNHQNEAKVVFSFYFDGGNSGHAIGLRILGHNSILFDPNYGMASYSSAFNLVRDLRKLLGSYGELHLTFKATLKAKVTQF